MSDGRGDQRRGPWSAGQTEVSGWWTAEIGAELEALFREVDEEVAATRAVCWASGVCCDFEKADHVLFASAVEVAWALESRPGPIEPEGALCPFWRDRLCTLRERRPLGCRTYFCDERFTDRVHEIHEKYVARLRDIAERHEVPWAYAPFVAALRGRAGVERLDRELARFLPSASPENVTPVGFLA